MVQEHHFTFPVLAGEKHEALKAYNVHYHGESAPHLNNAMSKAHDQSKQRMQHAAKDLEECIAECRSLL
jgi:hypothetical protein